MGAFCNLVVMVLKDAVAFHNEENTRHSDSCLSVSIEKNKVAILKTM